MWYSGTVEKGKGIGKTIGFPTLNLDNPDILKGTEPGVYASRVRVEEKEYTGALYYGPRSIFGETRNVLEIYLFDFDREIYGQLVSFRLGPFIRPPITIKNTEDLLAQLKIDCAAVEKASM